MKILSPTCYGLALAIGLAGCASLPDVWSSPLKLETCKVEGVTEPLLCGTLAVREDRGDPDGRMINLKVVVLPATGEKTLPPLYDLAGGPGLPATAAAGYWATDGKRHRERRDIVLVDQRGTGGSGALDCSVSFASPSAPVLDLDVVRDCRERLSRNANLAHYTTAAAVEDLDAVRDALAHERIDLVGLSYGTRVAQEYLRAHPDHVRAMALLGTVSPLEKLPLSYSLNAQSVLDRLGEQCTADPRCHQSVNDLSGDVVALRRLIGSGPWQVTLTNGRKVRIEPGAFWEGVRKQLATTTSQRRLPWLLHQAAYANFEPLLLAMTTESEAGSNGLLLSVSCAEDTPRITAEEIASLSGTAFGSYRVQRQIAACKAWRVPLLDNPRPGYVTSDAPVLLLAGDMDHVTPVQWAEAVAAHLPNARVVVIPKLGHFPDGLTHMECYEQMLADFFTAGSARNLDVACVKSMQPPPFEMPSKTVDKPARKVDKKAQARKSKTKSAKKAAAKKRAAGKNSKKARAKRRSR